MLQNTLILILLIWSMNVIIFVHNYVCVKLFLEVEIDIIIPQLPCTIIIPRAHTIAPSKKNFFILFIIKCYLLSHSRTSGGMTSELEVLRR